MDKFKRVWVLLVLLALAGLVLPRQLEAQAPAKSLGSAVPEDVWLYARHVHNPERNYMGAHLDKVRTAFEESGIREEIASIMHSTLLVEAGAAEVWDKWSKLLGAVDWGSLIRNEFVLSIGFQKQLLIPELLVLARPGKEQAAQNLEAIKVILTELADDLESELVVTTSEKLGAQLVTLVMAGAPVALSVAVRDDVMVISTSPAKTEASLGLLAAGGNSILDSARYKEAMAKLPRMEDGESFVDVATLFATLRMLPAMVVAHAPGDPDAQAMVAVVDKLLGHLDMIDYVASVQHTEGFTNLSDSLAKLKPTAQASGLYPVFANQPAVTEYHSLVPGDALSFSVSAGIDFHALYKFVENFVAKEIPEGATLLEEWQEVQEEVGLNLDAEVLSPLGGGFVFYTVPAAVPNPMRPADTVVMLKAKDRASLQALVDKGLERLREHCEAENIMFNVSPVAGTDPYVFKSVMFQFLPMLQPCYGFVDDYLVITTSSGAAGKLALLKQGKAPNVLTNPNVQKLRPPKGPVCSVDYTNLQSEIQQQAQVVGMMGMQMMAIRSFLPQMADAGLVEKVLLLVPRLAPVIQAFDFLEHELTSSTFDKQAGTWRVRKAVSIRPPTK